MSIARIYDGLLIPWQNLHYTSLSIRISLTFHGGLTAVMTPYFLRAILTVALILVGTRSTVAADMPKLAQQDGRFGFSGCRSIIRADGQHHCRRRGLRSRQCMPTLWKPRSIGSRWSRNLGSS